MDINLTKEPDPALDALAKNVIGAALEVHRTLGPGYLEMVYEEALCVELGLRGLSFKRQFPISVMYKSVSVGEGRFDLLVEQQLIVELKAVEAILPVHKAQVISYLKATRCQLGLLINFNVHLLRQGLHRIILS